MNIKQIALNSALKEEEMVVPQWTDPDTGEPVKLIVREMNGAQRAHIIKLWTKERIEDVYPDLAIGGCFEPATGEPAFSQADRDVLKTLSGGALALIGDRIVELSGLKADAVDEAEKN